MENKKLKPIDIHRQEKRALKRACAKSEDQLAKEWNYARNNLGSLLFTSAADSMLRKIGIGQSKSVQKDDKLATTSIAGVGNKLVNALVLSAPLLWEIAQPMLLKAAMGKVKSLFTRKKYDEDDGRYQKIKSKNKKSRWW